jgi:KipI family sensor histidine kinase inhibitor
VSARRFLPAGPHGVLVETDEEPALLAEAIRSQVAGVVDVVPAASTVLVTTGGPVSDVVEALRAVTVADVAASQAPDVVVTIEVRYDGADLDEIAAACAMATDDVVRLHTAPTYRVAFCGFAPGFAYLTGLAPELHLARRATPRPRVPAGSVAIASRYSAVYPSASPGGWHLLGRTDADVWDVDRDPPALLAPGTAVRFVPVGGP